MLCNFFHANTIMTKKVKNEQFVYHKGRLNNCTHNYGYNLRCCSLLLFVALDRYFWHKKKELVSFWQDPWNPRIHQNHHQVNAREHRYRRVWYHVQHFVLLLWNFNGFSQEHLIYCYSGARGHSNKTSFAFNFYRRTHYVDRQ